MKYFLRAKDYLRVGWIVIVMTVVTLFYGCRINRYKNGVRVGKWVEENRIDSVVYKRIEFYKKGIEKGTWKVYRNKILLSKEKYRNDTCYTKFYHSNGKTSSLGKSIKIREKDDMLHWFYIGEWRYFDAKGTLELIRIYDGSLNPKEIEIKK